MSDNLPDDIEARLARAYERDEGRYPPPTLAEQVTDKALEAKDRFTEFAKEHPVATVAGGIVLGVAIAAMFKGPRRMAKAGGSRAAGLAAIGSQIALGFASQLIDGAQDAGRSGASKASDLGGKLRENLTRIRNRD